jgi:two-component system chemotaxis sensor kinase CheA
MPRNVRMLVRRFNEDNPRLNMHVNLETSGGEIELDKKVLEEIVAPLDHIIRNSFAHGFGPEPPAIRKTIGKPEAGTIKVSASSESGFVVIKISDDGIGIDPDIIRERAVEKGLMNLAKAQSTPDDEIVNVIFESQFSTRKIIDDLSGRGVGMDVVKNNVERLNGQVSVSSQKGQGTTVTLKVPLTFAISRALMVRLGMDVYAIPAPAIQEMRYLTSDEVLTREGRDIVLHASTVVPLMRLAEVLGGNKNASHPLFRYMEMEGGRMALGTMPTGIVARPSSDTSYQNGNGGGGGSSSSSLASPFTGLVLADPQAQTRIQALRVENESKPVRQLSYERIPAVVVGTGDRKVCFIVDELVDETEIVLKSLNPILATADYVSSATIMGDGRVVLILDVPSLINATKNGGRTMQRRGGRDTQVLRKRILVVDDSITTRELEKSILEAQGYEVDLADDGTVALERLRQGSQYDLVVSDVEMPRMNGFELTKNIKADPNLRRHPVIIVSSLNSEDNKRRGIEAGASAYITKGEFNQNNLLDTIEYLTSQVI